MWTPVCPPVDTWKLGVLFLGKLGVLFLGKLGVLFLGKLGGLFLGKMNVRPNKMDPE
jgi:hypothetical protein